jgi:hypothetical protein
VRHGAGDSVTAWFITTEPVRALMTMRAAGEARSSGQVLDVGQEADARVGRWAFTRTTRPSSAWAVPAPLAC